MSATPSLFNQHLPPLADRIRPQSLDEFIGQSHLIDDQKLLAKLLEKEQLFSLIFWGPPGTGKTTLARIIANTLKAAFHELSAVSSGVKDLRKVIDKGKRIEILAGQLFYLLMKYIVLVNLNRMLYFMRWKKVLLR